MTAGTNAILQEEWFDAEHAELRFCALLGCENQRCQETVVCTGRGEILEVPDENDVHEIHVNRYSADYVNPSPPLIKVPKRCPEEVSSLLKAVYVATWNDYSAAANRLRGTVEVLLTCLKIPRRRRNKKGKLEFIKLHDRIELLPTRYAAEKDQLFAIKWLGNSGSHEHALNQDDVYDALDILENVLHTIFSGEPKRIRELVAQVNRRKGPLSPRPR